MDQRYSEAGEGIGKSAGEEFAVVRACEEERGRLRRSESDGDGKAGQTWTRET